MLCMLSSSANLSRPPELVKRIATHHFSRQGQRTVTKTGASREGHLPPGSVLIPMQAHQAEACSDKVKLLQMYEDFKAKGFPEVADEIKWCSKHGQGCTRCNTVLLWLQVQDIDVEGLQKLLQQQPGRVLLLDVRTPDEQAVSVIDGPVVLKSDFEKNREQYRDAQLVSYWSAMYKQAKQHSAVAFDCWLVKQCLSAAAQSGPGVASMPRC